MISYGLGTTHDCTLEHDSKLEEADFDLSKPGVNILQSVSDSEPHERFRKVKPTRKRKHEGNI